MRAREQKDVPSVRVPLLEAVYSAVSDFGKHNLMHVIDAWLSLVHWDDSLQRGLMSDPSHCAFNAVTQRLEATYDPQQLKLLTGYLLRSTTPKSILALVCDKADSSLALELSTLVNSSHWAALKRRLRELPPLACLENIETAFANVSIAEKKHLWLLASVSSRDYAKVLRGAIQIAKLGNAESRAVSGRDGKESA